MTSRVDELLMQLERIDYRNSICEPTLNRYNSDPMIKDNSDTKKNPIKLTPSPCLREVNLKSELQDSQVSLRVLSVQKKKEKINMSKQCDKIDTQVLGYKQELEKIEKQLSGLETKAETIEKVIKEKQDEKLEAFRYALKPLEDTANTILEEKNSLNSKSETLKSRLAEIDLLRNSKTEELKVILSQRSEYNQNREKLQEVLLEIKEKDPYNYKEYIQEIESKEILNAIKNRKSKQTAELKEIEKKLAEIEVQIQKCVENLNLSQKNDSNVPVTIEKEIEDLESYLNLLCKDLKVPVLHQYIKDQIKKKGYEYEGLIIANQINIIEEKELELQQNWKKEKEHMESKIIEMTRITEEQEIEIYQMIQIDSKNSRLETALEDMQKDLEKMKKEAERAHRIHKAKMAAIANWKSINRQKALISDILKIPEDNEIVKGFKRELQKSIPKLDQWKSIENIINRYFEKITESNNSHQNALLKEKEINTTPNNQSSQLKELQASKNSLLAARDSLHKEFLKIITLTKAAAKKFENSKLQLETERSKIIEKATEESMGKNKSGLLQIQKTFGDKAIKKIRDKESQTIKENHENQREEVKKKLDGVSSDISHWESLIIKIDSTINETLKPEIFLIDQETVRIKQELEVILQQISILNEAEDEVSAKLNFLMESKKRDIHRSLHRTLEINGGDVDIKKIHRLTVIKDKKESAIAQLTDEKNKIEAEYMEKLKNIELEEVKLKARVAQIEQNIETLKQAQKNFETMAKQSTTVINDIPDDEILEKKLLSNSEIPEIEETEIIDLEEPDRKSETKELEEEKNLKEEFRDESINNSKILPLEPNIIIDYEDTTPQEQQFIQSILPLLNGTTIYKKLSQRNSLQVPEYDPLDSENPEAFGYGNRNLKLNKTLTKIEFRHISKPGIESSVLVEHILAPVIPKHTSEMIKAQKKNWLNENKEIGSNNAINKKYKEMKTSGLMNYNDPAFKIKSKEADNYPFFITLEKGGRVELVATGYSIFKQWIDGISSLIKYKKQLGRLRYKIN